MSGYRESATTELHFNDRQLEWIERTSSLDHVRAFLKGSDPLREDAADATVCFQVAGAVALMAVGAFSFIGDDALSVLGVLAAAASAVLGLIAALRFAVRLAREREARFEVLTFVPQFERRVLEREEHDASPVTYVEVHGKRRVWPPRLESLRVSLGQEERIRVCIVHRNGRLFIEWAFPA